MNFSCFKCNDGNSPLYCLNCAEDVLHIKMLRIDVLRKRHKLLIESLTKERDAAIQRANEANTEYGRERQEHAATKLALVAQQELCERLSQRAEKAEALAYIGDHHHPDLTWKSRCLEEHAAREKAEACLAGKS